MSLAECIEHGKKHSKTYDKKTDKFFDNSPWVTNQDAMCLKTVLIQLCKVLPLSFELQKAIEQDEASREYRKGVTDVLETPSMTNWDEPKQIDEPAPPVKGKDDKPIEFGE